MNRKSRIRIRYLVLLAGLSIVQTARGDESLSHIIPDEAPRPTAYATLTDQQIIIDGRLNEKAWESAETIDGFVQAKLQEGYPATEPTSVKLLYDDVNLYVGAVCYDSEPDKLVIESLQQDFETHNSDVFALTLDTFFDRSNAFMFLFNPMGAIKDGQVFNDSRNPNLAWEGVIEVKTVIHDEGWNVELAIPFSTLRFDPSLDEQKWGLNFLRRVRRKNEDSYWAPLPRRGRVHKMSKAGTLLGIKGIKSGRNLSVKPFGSVGSNGGENSSTADGGADIKWGVTPSLTLDMTYNTDFSQVEADRLQINLDRFPLFFPEKRDFFIENAGAFTFGDVTERNYRMGASLRDFTLFHSRRIGLEKGSPIPIVAGGRLTGRVKDVELGALAIQTERLEDSPAEQFQVFRLRRHMEGNSDIGAMVIQRQETAASDDYNRSFGVDANLRFFGNLVVSSYLAGTTEPGSGGGNLAGRISTGWRDGFWDISAFYKEVGEQFNPGVGFVRRKGVRHAYATLGAHPALASKRFYKLNPYGEFHYVTDLNSAVVTRTASAALDFHFRDGSVMGVKGVSRFERVDSPFSIGEDVTIDAADYSFGEIIAFYRSNASLPLFGNLRLSSGTYFAGEKRTLSLDLAGRVGYRLTASATSSINNITYSGQNVTANVYGLRFNYSHTTAIHSSIYLQYNTVSDEVVSNLRVNLIHSPLSDVFLVILDHRNASTGDAIDRALVLKVTKLFSL